MKKTRKDLLSPTPHSEIEILHNLMRSPDRSKEMSVTTSTENTEPSSQATDENGRRVLDCTYESFQLQPETKLLALPPPESSETKEERFNSFQVVANQDTNKSSRSPSPHPNDSNKNKTLSESKGKRKSPSPRLELINNNKPQETDEAAFRSFQVCPQQTILALPSPTSASTDPKEKSTSKTEFDSFQIFSEEVKSENDANGNKAIVTDLERNRMDISSFSSEVSKITDFNCNEDNEILVL